MRAFNKRSSADRFEHSNRFAKVVYYGKKKRIKNVSEFATGGTELAVTGEVNSNKVAIVENFAINYK